MPEHLILFQAGDATYAVRSSEVWLVDMVDRITRVPNAPDFVEGVAYLRGQVVPVVNLRARFGLEKIPYTLKTRLLVIRLKERLIALVVDSARDFIKLPEDQILPPPEDLTGPGVAYLEGVFSWKDRLVLVVNLQRLFDSREREALETPMPSPSD